MPETGIDLIEWRPVEKGSLRGIAMVRLQATGLAIGDVAVHAAHGRAWASLPCKAVRDAAGEVRYAPILRWVSQDVAHRFSAAVVAEVERCHPGAVLGNGDTTLAEAVEAAHVSGSYADRHSSRWHGRA